MEPYQIIHAVFDAFKGLPKKLARISSKSEAWYQSHGRAPKTEDPIASGNVSAVTHYIRYARRFESVEPGAGIMLNNRVHAALDEEFHAAGICDQRELHVDVIDETSDVERWLARFDISTASRNELLLFEDECDQAVNAIMVAKGNARAKRKQVELRRVPA